uniref:Uncharacterized protein n=1 Tax=Amphimedon queenslandica TaxID=400682 RepID=A0A1X7V8K1_AMPQE
FDFKRISNPSLNTANMTSWSPSPDPDRKIPFCLLEILQSLLKGLRQFLQKGLRQSLLKVHL